MRLDRTSPSNSKPRASRRPGRFVLDIPEMSGNQLQLLKEVEAELKDVIR
jgi:hypothetical protein